MTRPTPSRPHRRARLAVAAAVALLTVACATNEAGTPTTTTATTTTTTAAAATTTVATTAPTTTGTSYDDVETAIREAHTRVMTELFARDERVTGPEAILPLAEELLVDPMLQRVKESAAARLESGRRTVSPGFISNIKEVQIIDAENAWVFDCLRDPSESYSVDGELLTGADDFYQMSQSLLVLRSGRWLVSDILAGGEQRCDPAE